MQAPEASVCLLNLMNADTGAYDSARTPLGSIADMDQLLGDDPHTYYVLAGIKNEATLAEITRYLAIRGLAYASSHSSQYGRGVHRCLCAALSAPDAPQLTWTTSDTELGQGCSVVRQTFAAQSGIEVCLVHTLCETGTWPTLSGHGVTWPAPAAPQKEKIEIKRKPDGAALIECITYDCMDI
jgi:hypothetical protein